MKSQAVRFDTGRINAISITEVARRLDEVRKAGSVFRTHCPWHEDRHPSLVLYERTDENHCHCFSCGRGGSVINYVMQHEGWTFREACEWLSHEYGIINSITGREVLRPKPRRIVKPPESAYTYIPREMLDALVSSDSSLCRCLLSLFHPDAVEWAVEEYRLGCYAMNGLDDYTVFPNIDRKGRVCNLKIQHYDTDTQSARYGHSDQTAYWLGRIWERDGRLPAGAEFRSDCLFGEHLLPRYPEGLVMLVESPKNAIFGALEHQELLWIATGNKGMLKREVLKPLQGRDVIVIPDCDAINEWQEAINGMKDLANFIVSDFCRRMAPAGKDKFDIADYIAMQHAIGI